MAVSHYDYNPQTPQGRLLQTAMLSIESARDQVKHVRDTMVQMKNGSALDAYAVGKYGFPDTTVANAALAELDSLNTALAGIVATIDQACARFRSG